MLFKCEEATRASDGAPLDLPTRRGSKRGDHVIANIVVGVVEYMYMLKKRLVDYL